MKEPFKINWKSVKIKYHKGFESAPGNPEVSWKCHKCKKIVTGTKTCPQCDTSMPS